MSYRLLLTVTVCPIILCSLCIISPYIDETSECHARLVHKLVSQFVRGQRSLVEKYPTSGHVPKVSTTIRRHGPDLHLRVRFIYFPTMSGHNKNKESSQVREKNDAVTKIWPSAGFKKKYIFFFFTTFYLNVRKMLAL